MAKVELIYAELHNPLFIGGTSFGMKLYPKQAKGELKMLYDREHKELLITFKNHESIVPSSNIASMTPSATSLKEQITQKVENTDGPHKAKPGPKPKISSAAGSQASTPHDHVFAGLGAGKTRD